MALPHTPVQAGPAAAPVRTNWAGNYTFSTQHLAQPASTAELQRLLPTLQEAKSVGSRHSFNHIADTTGTQIDLVQMKSMQLDAAARTATIGGGVTYGELAPWLHRQGFAVHNLASLPHISVAGACATATHGSGLANGCLSTAVRSMDLVTSTGDLVTLSRDTTPDAFRLAAVHLGALGVVSALTLDLLPSFDVAQMIYTDLNFSELQYGLREIFSAGYSVSLFTNWQAPRATQACVKRIVVPGQIEDFPDTFFGAARQTQKLHPLPNISAESCTEQLGQPGPWFERLPHFRLDYTPSAGAELQTEYFVPLEQAYDAIVAVERLRERITPHLLINELRTVAADDLPMSMAYRRDSLAMHFTWKQDLDPVLALLPAVEEALAPFGARPHWGKLFTVPASRLPALYPELDSFRALAQRFDPRGVFRNAFLRELLFPPG